MLMIDFKQSDQYRRFVLKCEELRVKYQNLFDASAQGRDDAFKSATLTRMQQQCNNEA